MVNDEIEQLIFRETRLIENVNEYGCFQRDHIPPKKLRNSLEKVGKNELSFEDVIFLIDCTVMGSSKKGFIFTQDTLYWSVDFTPDGRIRYEDIEKVYLTGDDHILINEYRIFINLEFKKQSLIEKLLSSLAETCSIRENQEPASTGAGVKTESDLINLSKVIMDFSMRIPNINTVWYYRKHHISPKRMDGAVLAIANGSIEKDDVVLVLDTTVMGRGKVGMVFTKDRFFWNDDFGRSGSLFYSDINEIKRPSKYYVSINKISLKFVIDELILRIMCDLLLHLRNESWRILQWYADQGIYVQGGTTESDGQHSRDALGPGKGENIDDGVDKGNEVDESEESNDESWEDDVVVEWD